MLCYRLEFELMSKRQIRNKIEYTVMNENLCQELDLSSQDANIL